MPGVSEALVTVSTDHSSHSAPDYCHSSNCVTIRTCSHMLCSLKSQPCADGKMKCLLVFMVMRFEAWPLFQVLELKTKKSLNSQIGGPIVVGAVIIKHTLWPVYTP